MTYVRRSPRAAGFTLMELMVTMAIAASLLGLGAGLFVSMGKRTAFQNALSSLQGVLVTARNASSRYPCAVLVDTENQVVQAMTHEVVQELHFDPRAVEGQPEPIVEMGIEGRDCDAIGARVDPVAGRVGGALRLEGGRVDCGRFAAYDVTDGVGVDMWVRPDALGTMELVRKGDALAVRLEAATRYSARVTVTLGLRDEHGIDKITKSCDVPPVRAGEWLGISVTYDRKDIVVTTDNGFGPVVRMRSGEGTLGRRLATSPDESLLVGGFAGWMDDFRFSGVHADEPLKMPEGVNLVGKPRVIRFVGGRLDGSVHPGTERIAMQFSTQVSTLAVSPNGMLQLEAGAVAPGTAAPPEGAPPPPPSEGPPLKRE